MSTPSKDTAGGAAGSSDDLDLINDLLEIDSGLTEWELTFAESVAKQMLDLGRAMTAKQRAKALSILERFEV